MHSPLVPSKRSYLARRTQSRTHGKTWKRSAVEFFSSAPCCGARWARWLPVLCRSRLWVANLERPRSSSTRVWDSWVVNLETSAKLVGTSVRLVAGWRWNEWGTRCWSHSEVADFPLLLVLTQKSQTGQILWPWTLGSGVRTDSNGRCSASFAVTGECSDESELCTWSSLG